MNIYDGREENYKVQDIKDVFVGKVSLVRKMERMTI